MNRASLFAERIGGSRFGQTGAIYKFEKIKRAKAAAREARPEVELLDFGVGEPDCMAPVAIREALKQAVDEPGNRGYADNGIPAFKRAAAEYLRKFFGVTGIDPETEIVHSIGSKSALAMLPLAFVNPGDAVLVTTPGYPVLATHARYLGGDVVPVPLRRENGFLPDLRALDPVAVARAKLFYVNYPNNPTGASAPPEFWDELIAFAEANSLLIVQDAAYATLIYGQTRHSILGRPGGKEHAVELHSMSKSYNMTGWRLGFVAGSASAVRAFAEVKDNCDSGQFKAIQVAACAGIADVTLSEAIRGHYRVRLEKLVAVLSAAGFEARMPGGTFYLYVPAPVGAGGQTFQSAEDASQFLIREALISTVPWDDQGAFLRFSATFESAGDADDDRVLGELKKRLLAARLRFGPARGGSGE
ncbi:MAG: aminotransferase class I/II-fold pyridoxal phosphate-dependent enzyme [Kiritimatiellia bacterium]|nr:aminotransferase class I/II-fold pyridoxal phosphate-dependent enzyme [Kiritimatiellia bacterium]